MKNELLVRAISEIDDDLIEEARRPLPRKKRTFTVISRFAAAAACFAVIVFSGIALFGANGDIAVYVNEADVLSGEPAEIGSVTAAMARTVTGTEIPLSISANGKKTVITAGNGGILKCGDGVEYTELTVSEDTEIVWVVDTANRSSFELRLESNGKTAVITAKKSQNDEKITLTGYYK